MQSFYKNSKIRIVTIIVLALILQLAMPVMSNISYAKDATENLKTEEPKVEESKAEEPKAEEETTEEPKVQEPKIAEPKTDQQNDMKYSNKIKKLDKIDKNNDIEEVQEWRINH